MDEMLIATFDTEAEAYVGQKALKDLHREGDITLYATAIITKDFNGEVTVNQEADKGPVGTSLGLLTGALLGLPGGLAGAAVGAATTGIGASVGALTGLVVDANELDINASFVEEVSAVLLPGKTAVLAEIEEDSVVPVNTEIGLIGGLVFRIPRDEVIEDQQIDESIALNAELDELDEQAKSARAERKEAMKKTRDSIVARLNSIVDKTSKKINEIEKETEAKVKKLESQMKAAKDKKKADIEKRITELKAAQKLRIQKLKKAKALAKEALVSK